MIIARAAAYSRLIDYARWRTLLLLISINSYFGHRVVYLAACQSILVYWQMSTAGDFFTTSISVNSSHAFWAPGGTVHTLPFTHWSILSCHTSHFTTGHTLISTFLSHVMLHYWSHTDLYCPVTRHISLLVTHWSLLSCHTSCFTTGHTLISTVLSHVTFYYWSGTDLYCPVSCYVPCRLTVVKCDWRGRRIPGYSCTFTVYFAGMPRAYELVLLRNT